MEAHTLRAVAGAGGPRAVARDFADAGLLPHAAAIGSALALWAIAVAGLDPTGMSGYGLLPALSVPYYLALVVLAGGFAVAVGSDRPRPALLCLYVMALIAVLHATTAIAYPEPRYAWTYKHVGVIEYIAAHGSVDRSIDIYQNWPGFFALTTWLSATMGVKAIDFAAWAQVAFGLMNVAALLFALRGLTRDVRLQWTAAWLFVIANWIGQDYLAPQAMGFLLSIVVIGVIIRCAPLARPPRTPAGWAAMRAMNRIATACLRGRRVRPQERETAPLARPAALGVGAVLFLAVVVSHQLSPVMVLLAVGSLAVATRRPPLWVIAGMAAIQIWWLWLGYEFVSTHFGLFEFDPSLTAASTAETFGPGLPGVSLADDVSRATMLALLLLALAGVVRRTRAGHWDIVPLALAGAPVLLLGLQSYGGEGPLRIYLFAMPWLVFFAAAACVRGPSARGNAARSWRVAAATLVIGSGAVFGLFRQEPVNYMTRDDIRATSWYLDNASRASNLTLAAMSVPERPVASYANHLSLPDELLLSRTFRARLAAADVPGLQREVERQLGSESEAESYLLLTPSQERYLRYYAVADDDGIRALRTALLTSPRLRVEFRSGDALVLSYRRGPACFPSGPLGCLPGFITTR